MTRIAFIGVGARREDWLDYTVSACRAASRYNADLIILTAGFQPFEDGWHPEELACIYNSIGLLSKAPIALVVGPGGQQLEPYRFRLGPHGYRVVDDYLWVLEDWRVFNFQGVRIAAIGTASRQPHFGANYDAAQLVEGHPVGVDSHEQVDLLITHAPPLAVVMKSAKEPGGASPSLKLATSISAAESLLRPRFHFYSDMHKGLAEFRESDSSAAVDPRGELVFFDAGSSYMIRTDVKVAPWKLKHERRSPAGRVSARSLVPMGTRGE